MEKYWFLKPGFVRPLPQASRQVVNPICRLPMTAVGKVEWIGTLAGQAFRLS